MQQTSARRLPTRGPGRLAALSALERVLVADTIQTLGIMTADGWSVDDALDAYRAWWHRTVSAAIDEGTAEWTWRGVA